MEGACLRLEARTHALDLNRVPELDRLGLPATQAQPDDACQAAALEGAGGAQRQLEGRELIVFDPIGDLLDDPRLHVPEETNREVQVLRRRPPELRRELCQLTQMPVQQLPLLAGQRQGKERANLQRPSRLASGDFFCQFVGAQALGAVGRQPKCVLTESMPSARLSTWIISTSSGVIGGFFDSASIATAGIETSGVGSFNFVFLMLRACRNQSKTLS